jgi:hypothetical protein
MATAAKIFFPVFEFVDLIFGGKEKRRKFKSSVLDARVMDYVERKEIEKMAEEYFNLLLIALPAGFVLSRFKYFQN